jgi:rubrerythrin
MDEPTDRRRNRTGALLVPRRTAEMLEGVEDFLPDVPTALDALDTVRAEFIREAEPHGSMPPPGGLKQLATEVATRVQGKDPAVFLDKLGARLAFERSGTRLYQALVTKARSLPLLEGGPTVEELEDIRRDEQSHFDLVAQAIEDLGGDPTVVTPSANVEATASLGLMQVVTDPRTSLRESLHAIHIAELADNDAWAMLIAMANDLGQEELAERFRVALRSEERHLENVRRWMVAMGGLDTDEELLDALHLTATEL